MYTIQWITNVSEYIGGDMVQQLQVNLTIPIPADQVLISKIELAELKANELQGVYWTMKDLENRIGKKHIWIKENILYPSRFRNILDVKKGGFVYYPEITGEKWAFQATRMAQFLEDHFYTIFKKED